VEEHDTTAYRHGCEKHCLFLLTQYWAKNMVRFSSRNRSSPHARSAFRNSHIQKPLGEYAATGITMWLWHKFSEPGHLEYKRIGEGACGVAYATSWPWKSMSWGEPGGHLASGRYARADFCRGFAGILQVKIRQQVSGGPILVPVFVRRA
jgi:hypothetical protein